MDDVEFYEELDECEKIIKSMAEFKVSSKFSPRKGGRVHQLPPGSIVDLPGTPHGADPKRLSAALDIALDPQVPQSDFPGIPHDPPTPQMVNKVIKVRKKGGKTFVKGKLSSGQTTISSFEPHTGGE